MSPQQARGHEKRALIARAAADIAAEHGFAAVSHRRVAARAGVPLGSTTYYFASLDELLGVAADTLCADWLAAARAALDDASKRRGSEREPTVSAAHLLVRIVLPDDDDASVLNYYEQLLAAARHPAVAAALRSFRPGLESMLADALALFGVDAVGPRLVLAVIDGAAVGAVSEGRPHVASIARDSVASILTF